MSIHLIGSRWPTPVALRNAFSQVPHNGNELYVNWGIGDANREGRVLNPGNAVALAANKYRSLVAMRDNQESAQFTPALFANINQVNQWPVVGRPFHHTQGRSFWMLRGPADIERMNRQIRRRLTRKQPPQYFMQYIQAIQEYRVHVFYDGVNGRRFRVIRINRKVRTRPNEGNGLGNVVKSHRNGWTFEFVEANDPTLGEVRRAARRAVKALGLHFGAVDIGVTADGRPFVYEVNTAPGLDDGGLARYVTFITNQYNSITQWRPPQNAENA